MSKKIANGKLNLIVEAAAIIVCMIVAVIVCLHKSGFHVDEYYTYYSSNRTYGLWVEDGKYLESQSILDELNVISGQGFNFRLVKEVQSWDVHPPIYYFFIHLVCSLFPDDFSMLPGLAVNLISFLICLLLIYRLSRLLIPEYPLAASFVTLLWGLSAATLSIVVFIRMYMFLSIWILAVTILHIKKIKNEIKSEPAFYIALGVITFLGFMTHYYFFIWLFFLACAYNLWNLLCTRRFINIIKYGITMIITFALCYLYYPAFPGQMFNGQRGAQARGNFFDLSNTVSRIAFFGEKINRIGFGHLLWIAVLLIIIGYIFICLTGRRAGDERRFTPSAQVLILAASCAGYFLVVSKTGLLLEDTSIRYQMPVISVAMIMLATAACELYGVLMSKASKPIYIKSAFGALMIIFLAAQIIGDFGGNISFLYPEKMGQIAFMEENADKQIVYSFNPDQTWCVWDSVTELITQKRCFMVDGNAPDVSVNQSICDADGLILFVDNAMDSDKVINNIKNNCAQISTFTHQYDTEYYAVYLCE